MNVLLILFFFNIPTTVWRALIIWLSRVCARVCEMQTKEKWCRHPRSVEFVCRLVDDSYSSLPATNPASSWVNNPFLSFLSCVFFCSFLFFFLGGRNGDESNQFAAPVVFFFLSICVLSLFYFVSFLFFSRVCPPSLRVWSVVIESVIERRFLLPTAPDCWGRLEIDVWRRLYSFTGFYRVFFSSASLAASIIWSMLIESVIDCWSLLWIHLWWHLYSFIWLLKFALNWCSMALIESLDWIELVFSFWSHLIAEVCSWLILDGVCAVEPDCWSLLLIDVRLRQYSFTGFLPSLFFFSHSHCFHVWSVSIEFVIEVVFCWWSYLIAEVGTLWGSLITGFYRVFISAAVRWPLLLLSPLIGMRFNP